MGTSLRNAAPGWRTCMRRWRRWKLGRPVRSSKATISPSSTAERPPRAPASAASSGYPPVTSLPRRLAIVTRPSWTVTTARTPSHFGSMIQPSNVLGSDVVVASMGASCGGSTA